MAMAGFAQTTGSVIGKILNSKTGEPMYGVTVSVKGTTIATQSDTLGKFKLGKVPAGAQTIVFSSVGFERAEKPVTVEAGRAAFVETKMEIKVSVSKVTDINAKMDRSSTTTVTLERKNSALMTDVISADVIRKTPDRNTGDVIKRVSGASIQDGKFVIIRGLNDRYNAAFLNGAPLPSTESDRKAFSFDVFPSNLLEALTISKTASADMPAEFAGGIIQVSTKDIPEETFFSAQLGGGMNTLTTFKNFYMYPGSFSDKLGLGAGYRALPNAFPTSDQFKHDLTLQDKINWTRQVNTPWSLNQFSARPALNLQLSAGSKFRIAGKEAGTIFALSYSSNLRYTDNIRQDFDQSGTIYRFKDSTFRYQVLGGLMWNTSVKLNKNNRISFRNLYSVNSENQVILRSGTDYTQASDILAYSMMYSQNQVMSSQVSGQHDKVGNNVKIKWNLGYSAVVRDIPDYRRLRYTRPSDDQSIPYQAYISFFPSPNDGGRFYSKLNENSWSFNWEAAKNFEKAKTEVKIGTYSQYRSRTFQARNLGFMFNGNYFDQSLLTQDFNHIFSNANIDSSGFYLEDGSNYNDKYTASALTNSVFAMADTRLKKLRLVYGLRYENYHQEINTRGYAGDTIKLNSTVGDLFPSLNATYSLTKKSNIRFAASKTVSRPEFRELAPFAFFDFSQFVIVQGNSKLTRGTINNYDLRYEIYPGAGQSFSVTAFYKQFTSPIEQVLDPNFSGGTRTVTYANLNAAITKGFEAEMRLNIGKMLHKGDSSALSGLTIMGNYAWIRSQADISKVAGAEFTSRPLQGQSPYLINAGILYSKPGSKFGFSMMANQSGRRIWAVGVKDYGSIYENPRLVIDAQITYKLKNLEFRVNAGDLLAQKYLFYQDINKNGHFDEKIDNTIIRQTIGRNISASVVWKLSK